jgi:hypothetical protein
LINIVMHSVVPLVVEEDVLLFAKTQSTRSVTAR